MTATRTRPSRLRPALSVLLFLLLPALIYWPAQSAIKVIPAFPWQLAVVCAVSALAWLTLRGLRKFRPRFRDRARALAGWSAIVIATVMVLAHFSRKMNVEFLAPDDDPLAQIVRAKAAGVAKFRLTLGNVTRPCMALLPNHNLNAPFVAPANGLVSYGLGVDRLGELEGRFVFQVLLQDEAGVVRKLDEVRFTEESIGWHDHRATLPPETAGRKIMIILQLRELESRPMTANPPLVFVNHPRVLAQDPARPNIILIVVDTLRADYVSYDPDHPGLTPRLAGLAGRGRGFSRHYTQSSITRPSTASLMTSNMPAQIGNPRNIFLSADQLTVAEAVRDAGWRTAGFSGNLFVSPYLGFDQGFEHFAVVQTFPFYCWKAGGALTDQALAWIGANPAPAFFLYLHYIDPHDPYLPPPEYIPLTGAGKVPLGEFLRTLLLWGPIPWPGSEPPARPPQHAETYQKLYAGEVRYIDDCVGRLVDELDRTGLLANTVIIFTTDHGEEFLDHGQYIHGTSLYREVIHAPFIIFDGRGQSPGPHLIDEVTSNLDVMPTILDYASVDPPAGVRGRSLRRAGTVPAAEGAGSGPAFSELPRVTTFDYERHRSREGYQDAYLRAMITDRVKIITVRDVASGGSKTEAYDLTADPLEQHNLAGRSFGEFEPERRMMEDFFKALPGAVKPGQTPSLPPEMIEVLKSLGYLQENPKK